MTIEQFRKYIDRYWLPVLICALAVFFYVFDPVSAADRHLFLKCIFHQATGFYCPGCGGQRAAHQLMHGHIGQAAGYNLLLVLILPLAIWHIALHIWNTFGTPKLHLSLFRYPLTSRVLLLAVLLFWLLRNIPVYPFTQLAP